MRAHWRVNRSRTIRRSVRRGNRAGDRRGRELASVSGNLARYLSAHFFAVAGDTWNPPHDRDPIFHRQSGQQDDDPPSGGKGALA